jgi:hypothetical protein
MAPRIHVQPVLVHGDLAASMGIGVAVRILGEFFSRFIHLRLPRLLKRMIGGVAVLPDFLQGVVGSVGLDPWGRLV